MILGCEKISHTNYRDREKMIILIKFYIWDVLSKNNINSYIIIRKRESQMASYRIA